MVNELRVKLHVVTFKENFAWISILLSIVFAEHIRFNLYVLNQCLITYIANNEVFKSIMDVAKKALIFRFIARTAIRVLLSFCSKNLCR